jgi:uncharacterized protein YyaL (SSP411 family)
MFTDNITLRQFVIAGMLSIVCLPAYADTDAPGDYWQTWSGDAFEQASAAGKLVLLDLTAEWCIFCKKMDQTTYRDPAVVKTIENHFIPVRAADETHPGLASRYARYGRPLTVIFKPDGTEVVARPGYLKPQWMLWFLQAVAGDPDPQSHN